MNLLLTEFLPEYNLYLVIPCIGNKPDPENEFVFEDEESQNEFMWFYFRNPVAAMFAYYSRLEGTNKAAEVVHG